MPVYLEKGTVILFSKRGHKGFFYPDLERSETTAVRAQVIPQFWLGSHLAPVLISEDSIFGTGSEDRLIPVWVERDQLIKE